MSQATPKPRSAELTALIARVGNLVSRASLVQVLASALERSKLERIVARSPSRPSGPFGRLSRDELAGHAADAFAASEGSAFDVVRELDRATENERTVVSSIEPALLTERFVTPAALAIKRHGALLVWAVVRDARFGPDLVGEVVSGYLAGLAEPEHAPRTDAPRSSAVDDAVSPFELERAHMIAEIGRREAALSIETARGRELEAQLRRLEAELAERPAAGKVDDATASVRRLEKKVAHLTRELEAAIELRAKLGEIENENETLKRTVGSLRGALETARASSIPAVAPPPEAAKGMPMAHAASAAVLAAIGAPLVEPPRRKVSATAPATGERVAVLVDVANIAGAARNLFQRSVDYHRLLADCVRGRTLVEARAYVIDKGQAGVDAFATSLRAAGYRVQLKRPKVFEDGSMKADWDMAIAVDALTFADRVDRIVLVSGDGDFVPLVQGLKRRGIGIEAVAFEQRAAIDLKRAVDQFTALDAQVLLA